MEDHSPFTALRVHTPLHPVVALQDPQDVEITQRSVVDLRDPQDVETSQRSVVVVRYLEDVETTQRSTTQRFAVGLQTYSSLLHGGERNR